MGPTCDLSRITCVSLVIAWHDPWVLYQSFLSNRSYIHVSKQAADGGDIIGVSIMHDSFIRDAAARRDDVQGARKIL